MIWSSFSTVVYPTSFSWLKASCTARTVDGPRSHKMRRISSSPAVGLGTLDLVMRYSYYEGIRIVNEYLRSGPHAVKPAVKDSLGRAPRLIRHRRRQPAKTSFPLTRVFAYAFI